MPAQITDLLRVLSQRAGTALMFIRLDLSVMAEGCTRAAIALKRRGHQTPPQGQAR